MDSRPHMSSITTLVGDALGQLSKLLQIELALAKAEIRNDVKGAGVNVGLLGAGALFLIPALVMVLFAIGAALINAGLSPPVAYIISAAIGAVIAFILIGIAMARMKAMSFVPERTVEQLRKDRRTIQEAAR